MTIESRLIMSEDDFLRGKSLPERAMFAGQLSFELSCKAVPVEQALEVFNFLPYASPCRVFLGFLFLTGCRPSEAMNAEFNNKNKSFIQGNYFYWRVGKNQKGQWRQEYLPSVFLEELNAYRISHKCYANKIFHTDNKVFTKCFNEKIRPYLGDKWRERTAVKVNRNYQYILQVKGFRKTMLTLCFWEYWEKYNSAEVALIMTCKRARHSHKGMTADHYIEDSERMNREKWRGWSASKIWSLICQTHIQDFDNSQKLILEYE